MNKKKKKGEDQNMSDEQIKKTGPEIPDEFYRNHIDSLIVNGKMPHLKNEFLVKLAEECSSNVKIEHLALSRYAKRNSLLAVEFDDRSENDDDFTAFGTLPHTAEHFSVDIAKTALFFDAVENKLKLKSEFIDQLTTKVFKTTRKPCCWSYGRIFTQSGDVKLHAVCLNENCAAVMVVYTENCQGTIKISVFGYDDTVAHSKKRYLTGNNEKKKVEGLLAIETAMVAHNKMANEYIFSEKEYAAHLSSKEALRQRKHRLSTISYRHEIAAISVQMMKSEPAFKHCMGDIGLDPQYVIFGVPLQKEFLLEMVARK